MKKKKDTLVVRKLELCSVVSRRRLHTRWNIMTGVQTCALPIFYFACLVLDITGATPAVQTTGTLNFHMKIGRAPCRERECQYV